MSSFPPSPSPVQDAHTALRTIRFNRAVTPLPPFAPVYATSIHSIRGKFIFYSSDSAFCIAQVDTSRHFTPHEVDPMTPAMLHPFTQSSTAKLGILMKVSNPGLLDSPGLYFTSYTSGDCGTILSKIRDFRVGEANIASPPPSVGMSRFPTDTSLSSRVMTLLVLSSFPMPGDRYNIHRRSFLTVHTCCCLDELTEAVDSKGVFASGITIKPESDTIPVQHRSWELSQQHQVMDSELADLIHNVVPHTLEVFCFDTGFLPGTVLSGSVFFLSRRALMIYPIATKFEAVAHPPHITLAVAIPSGAHTLLRTLSPVQVDSDELTHSLFVECESPNPFPMQPGVVCIQQIAAGSPPLLRALRPSDVMLVRSYSTSRPAATMPRSITVMDSSNNESRKIRARLVPDAAPPFRLTATWERKAADTTNDAAGIDEDLTHLLRFAAHDGQQLHSWLSPPRVETAAFSMFVSVPPTPASTTVRRRRHSGK